MSERTAMLAISVGTNKTGKTSRMKDLLQANKRNLVVPSNPYDPGWEGMEALKVEMAYGPDPENPRREIPMPRIEGMDTFTGTRLVHCTGKPSYFDAVIHTDHGFRNGGLFLDDFRNYVFTKGTLKANVGELFRARRHKQLDIFMACHDWADVSRDLLAFSPTFFVFRTTVPPTPNSVDKMTNADEFLACIDRVNRIARTDPYYFERFQPAE